jgi:hypothetical protein
MRREDLILFGDHGHTSQDVHTRELYESKACSN